MTPSIPPPPRGSDINWYVPEGETSWYNQGTRTGRGIPWPLPEELAHFADPWDLLEESECFRQGAEADIEFLRSGQMERSYKAQLAGAEARCARLREALVLAECVRLGAAHRAGRGMIFSGGGMVLAGVNKGAWPVRSPEGRAILLEVFGDAARAKVAEIERGHT